MFYKLKFLSFLIYDIKAISMNLRTFHLTFFPLSSQVLFLQGKRLHNRKEVGVFGNDYNTPDGTGVRDYIHVVDLAIGHVKALKKLEEEPKVRTYNLGTGQGYSVLEVIKAFSKRIKITK